MNTHVVQTKRRAWPQYANRSAASRGYGHGWRQLRRLVLIRDPMCRACGIRPSTDVDHRTPKAQGGTDDLANLQGLCRTCHLSKTARESKQGDPAPKLVTTW